MTIPPTTSPGWRPLHRLGAISAIVAAIWLLGLPWLSKFPPMAARLDWLDEQRVDPSAMYYTEVEALKPVLERLNNQGRRVSQSPVADAEDQIPDR
jgi:hypothetical protein